MDTRELEASNKAVVRKFFDAFSAGRTDDAFALVAEDVRWWVPGDLPLSGTKTKAEYLKIAGAIRGGFPDGFRLEITGMTAEDDRVAAEVASSGTHVSGRAYRNRYHFLVVLRDGKMIEVKEYMDTLHLATLLAP